MSTEILFTTFKRTLYVIKYCFVNKICCGPSQFVNAIRFGEYGKIFTGESQPPDLEMNDVYAKVNTDNDFFSDLTKQPDTLITITVSLIVPFLLCFGQIFTYKQNGYDNFFTAYFFSYLSTSFATLFVIFSLVAIALFSNKYNMGEMSNYKDSFLPLLCGFSYTYVPVLVAVKLSTEILLIGYFIHLHILVTVIILSCFVIYFSICSSKLSVHIMNAMPTMSKDRKHVWFVALCVFTIDVLLYIHIFLNMI